MKANSMVLTILFTTVLSAQVPDNIQRYRDDNKGDYQNRRQSIISGNRIRTAIYNYGMVGNWISSGFQPSMEWPIGSSHEYSDGFTFMVGAQVTAPGNNKIIHPIETAYREEVDTDPLTGTVWGMEPVEGYFSPSGTSFAVSNDAISWPSVWPAALNLPSDYNGHWYGYFGKDVFNASQESYFVMDDSKDGEFTRAAYGGYYPIAADSSRGGLGLRVEVRTFQWETPLMQDILFLHYDVWNISDQSYDSTALGYFVDPGIGGNSSGNDIGEADTLTDLVYMWDILGNGYSSYGNWKTGYMGISIVGSPENVGLNSFSINLISDKSANSVWPKNDEVMWNKLIGGIPSSAITNANYTMVIGSGPFLLPKWENTTYDAAVIMGNDAADVLAKKAIAQNTFDNNYVPPQHPADVGSLPLTIQSPLQGSTISGTSNIQWTVSGNSGAIATTINYTDDNVDWHFLATNDPNSGLYSWNTSSMKDGIFYRLRILSLAANGFGFAESDSFFTINNPGNVAPQVLLEMDPNQKILKGVYSIQWKGGDADGDSCHVNLYYKLQSVPNWTLIKTNLSASGSYEWSTTDVPNSSMFDYEVKAQIVSLSDTSNAISQNISISNPVIDTSGEAYVVTKKATGTGSFSIVVVDSSAVTHHSYLLAFHSSGSPATITCDVIDATVGSTKLSGIGMLDGFHETNYFDGIRLKIHSDTISIDKNGSSWTSGSSTLVLTPLPDYSIPELYKPVANDYQLTFYDTVKDTAFSDGSPQYPPVQVNFVITNVTTSKRLQFLVDDVDRNGILSIGDTIRIVEGNIAVGSFTIPYEIAYGDGSSVVVYPSGGDVYSLKTTKPFAEGDSIVFTTQGLTIVNPESNNIPAGFVLKQNYPNPFNPSTTIAFSIPVASHVAVNVYDLLGKEIVTLADGKYTAGEHSVQFNASHLPSGIYFYQIRAGNFVATKKLVLLK